MSPRLPALLQFAVLACSSGAWLGACTSQPKISPGSLMVVSAQKAAFFKYGPAQTFGADFQLAQGQTVTLLERSVGFSRVLGENGITGYVANEDIQLAAVPKATMPLNVAGKRESRSVSQKPGTQKHSHVEASPDTPLFDVSDLPALPVGPAAKPDPVKPN